MYDFQQLGNKPIVAVKFAAQIDFMSAFTILPRRINRMVTEQQWSHVWVITDYTDYDLQITDVIFSLVHQSKGEPGTASDPRVTLLLAGSNPLLKEMSMAARRPQHGNLSLPVFESVEQAIAYASYHDIAV